MKMPQFATVQQQQLYERYVLKKQAQKAPQSISKEFATDPQTGRLKKGYKYAKGGVIVAVKTK